MLAGTVEKADFAWQEAVMPDNGGAVIRFGDMLVSAEGALPSPHAIFVDQPANATIPPHYHNNAQYQIVIRGSGRLGTHAIRPIAVHYAAGQTVYGPIVAGPDGLVYLTLRAVTEFGAHWWPASRAEVRRRTRKWQLTEQADEAGQSKVMALAAVAVETVIAPQDSGLATWIVRAPPGSTLTLPSHPGGAGQFLVVTTGAMSMAGEWHQGLSTVWVNPDEQGAVVQASPSGLEVVVAQFPREALA